MSCCALALIMLLLLGGTPPLAHAQNGQQRPPRQQDKRANPSRAGQDFSGGWAYSPPSPEKSVEIGNFYLHRGDNRAALSRFKEALKTDPDYAPAYLGLGKAYEKIGELPNALAAYEKYLQELPSDRAAARAKDAHKAIASLKREIAKSKSRKGMASGASPASTGK